MSEDSTPAVGPSQNQPDDLPTEIETKSGKPGIQWSQVWPRVGIIFIVISITLIIILFRDEISGFAQYGLPGVFIISLLGNATLILPAPSLAFVFAMGSTLPPIQVGLAAGIGEALGELTGYLAGYAGSAVIENRAQYERIHKYIQKYGLFVIFVLSVIPTPLFDLAGIAAGTMRVSVWRFLLACWAGKTIKTTAVAFAGAGSVTLLSRLIEMIMK